MLGEYLFEELFVGTDMLPLVFCHDFNYWYRYASSFRFSGNYVDHKDVDHLGRHKTRVIAIDALCRPGRKQFSSELLLRYLILFQNRRFLRY